MSKTQPPQSTTTTTTTSQPQSQQPSYTPLTREQLEENLKQVKLHSQALHRQIVESERFYFAECTQHNIIKGWDSYTQDNPKQMNKGTKNEQLSPFSQTAFSLNSDTIRFTENLELYKSLPTIQQIQNRPTPTTTHQHYQSHPGYSSHIAQQPVPGQPTGHVQPANYTHPGTVPAGAVKRSFQ